MNKLLTIFGGWFSSFGGALGDKTGTQSAAPASSLTEGVASTSFDAVMQISTVWLGAEILCKLVGSLPFFVYENKNGNRVLARDTLLWNLFKETPNSRMTPMEFWVALMLNFLFHGNSYARLQRNERTGEVEAMWPMPATQVEYRILEDGTGVYLYRLGADVAVLAERNVLHIKEMGNGTIGMSRIDYMRSTVSEAKNAQTAASKLFSSGGKPTGVLMIDKVLDVDQRKKVKENFAEMASGSTSRLFLLEADSKYQQINMSPEDMQLLSSRKFSVEELGRWMGIPSIMLNQTEGTTTLGSSSGEILENFYKVKLAPLLVNIEQACRKRVLTSAQRARYTCEFSLDALLRANLKDRAEIYAKLTQNGIKTSNECRQLENDPAIEGGDKLRVQSNMIPIDMLGKITTTGGSSGTQNTISQ